MIPVKNGARFLEESIKSVLNQSVKPNEIIVVNDHSEDETPNLVREISNRASESIILIDNVSHGVSAARNTGIENASNDCIALLDVDDLWLPGKMKRQLNIYSNTKLVHTGYFLVDETLNEIKVCSPENIPNVDSIYSQEYLVTGSSSSVVFSKMKFIEAGRFDESLAIAEDLDLWIRMSSIVEIIGLQEPLIKIRRHNLSVQSDGRNLEYLHKELLSLTKVWNKNRHLSPMTKFPINNVISDYFAATKFSPIYLFRMIFNLEFMSSYLTFTNTSRFQPFELYLIRFFKVIKYKAMLFIRGNKVFRGLHKTILILLRKI